MRLVPVRRRRLLVVLGSVIVLTAAAVGYWAVFVRSTVDPGRELALQIAIADHLQQNHWGSGDQRARWFCEVRVIEEDQSSEESEVGFLTMCNQFSAERGELLNSSGEVGPKLAIVTSPPNPVEVLRIESPGDGSAYSPWIKANFSWTGAKKLHRLQASEVRNLENATRDKARAAFGLPPDAPVHR
ncbi:hypothetical protein [Lentzea flava]|uniref:Uncharacterized protein n=1 Tax=Lentzea flava TaxID=103732 RepID=A0ABQ2UDH1_9PSEU|nr:hypothetical protein [Lentzea flava]MCP2198083.1 hypothetical protein [Lentzea flava]GGU24532.1 hypothetical protein GCM10010178_16020 [Lentzea flava]